MIYTLRCKNPFLNAIILSNFAVRAITKAQLQLGNWVWIFFFEHLCRMMIHSSFRPSILCLESLVWRGPAGAAQSSFRSPLHFINTLRWWTFSQTDYSLTQGKKWKWKLSPLMS